MPEILDFVPNVSIPGLGKIKIPGIGEKSIPISNELSVKEIPHVQVLKIITERLVYKQNPAINAYPKISTVFGQPDFLPFPFLSLGVYRGNAVCRIVREFSSEESAVKFIDSIRKVEAERKQSFSIFSLAEICYLSNEKAYEIFQVAKNHSNNIEISLKPEHFFEKIKRIPVATGFLVGRNKLLTSYHIFPQVSSRLGLDEYLLNTEFVAEFNYEQDIIGRDIEPIEYKFEKLLAFNKDLDFALIKLEAKPKSEKYPSVGQAGDQFGWIRLLEDDSVIAPPLTQVILKPEGEKEVERTDLDLEPILKDALNITKDIRENLKGSTADITPGNYLALLKEKAMFGDPVNIIQHPKGRRKEVVLSNNKVQKLTENFILYTADTDFSSSGSPVLNQQWQLVGLHCGSLLKLPQESSDQKQIDIEIDMEIGVRTSQIVKDLIEQLQKRVDYYHRSNSEERKTTRELWFFVNEFVQLRESKGNIPVLPGFEEIEINTVTSL